MPMRSEGVETNPPPAVRFELFAGYVFLYSSSRISYRIANVRSDFNDRRFRPVSNKPIDHNISLTDRATSNQPLVVWGFIGQDGC